jgi:hypothetical protein
MHSDFEIVVRKAEHEYLQQPEIEALKHCVSSLRERLEIYECLRDREVEIFQPIAEQLLDIFPDEDSQLIKRTLQNWLTVGRYCAMAMLLNNPEFLEHRLLEWLAPIVGVHQNQAIENTLYDLLLANLNNFLSKQQLATLQPFLEQAKASLVNNKVFQPSGV